MLLGTMLGFAGLLLFFHSCSVDPTLQNPWYDPAEYYAGGQTTLFDASSRAFSMPAPNLSPDHATRHEMGDAQFEANFITAPAPVNSGLGPVFNNVSCKGCHILDGRGDIPTVFRISIPGMDLHGGPLYVPGFGTQLQDKAVAGQLPEGGVQITYTEETHYFPDGTSYQLRRPHYMIQNTYEPLPPGVMLSMRTAPPVFGLGLLEAIPEDQILALADPGDVNHDGISGRPNYIYDIQSGGMLLGRFGWKANQPTLLQQTAAAYNADIGITTPLIPAETCAGQIQDDGMNDDPEVSEQQMEDAAFYAQTLGVPAPRHLDDPDVLQGKMYFFQVGCAKCHVQKFTTGVVPGLPEISNQIIYPYTDMLLHDMGPDLADGRPDYGADGGEWRTRPLWGIGLTPVTNGHSVFLHDGRARNLLEAIMWHGGEAQKAKDDFAALSQQQRDQVIKFLQAL